MRERSPYSRIDVLVIALSTLVGAVISVLFMNWYLNRDNRWVPTVSPEGETAVRIVAVDRLLDPYVETQEGNLYHCSGQSWTAECIAILPAQLPPYEIPPRWTTCTSASPDTPPPPGEVVDSVEGGRCSEAETYGKVVLLSDGTLWQWQRTYTGWNMFGAATCVVLGLSFGAFAGVVAVRMRRFLAAAPTTSHTPTR